MRIAEEQEYKKKTPRPDSYPAQDEAEDENHLGPSRCGYTATTPRMEISSLYGQVGETILMAVTFI